MMGDDMKTLPAPATSGPAAAKIDVQVSRDIHHTSLSGSEERVSAE
jgi:hypothetical protein